MGHKWRFPPCFCPHPVCDWILPVKKFTPLLLLVSGLLTGGCSFGLPISPLMFLLKNDPPPLRQNAPSLPADAAAPDTATAPAANATA